MKKMKYLLLAALAAGALQSANALNYSSTDLVLVFRKDGQKDVEFDIGSVSNYLALAPGTRQSVAYNLNAVMTNFNNSLAGVSFAVVGTTSQLDPLPRVWLTDASVYVSPADVTFSKFSQLTSKIDSVGVNAVIYTASNAAPYVVATAASSSYDYLVTGGVLSSVTTLRGDAPTPVGGGTPLPVDAANPATIALYEVVISVVNPKPPATLVGGFTIDSAGSLYFTARGLPPLPTSRITDVQADPLNSQSSTVSFTTANGANYSLYYSPDLSGPWAPVPGAGVANGDGTVQSLIDYGATDPIRYYRIKTTY
jgi:hypothetical protein